ncbi:MAG: hypothetical protein DWH91_12125 [Planctomycetota bacterium]|nr:MAG: hypothetical protein DWH91_12125 [Planctomycetota bacterium]
MTFPDHNEVGGVNSASHDDGASEEIAQMREFLPRPTQIEQELLIGSWIVLAAADWSIPDHESAQVALRLSKRLQSGVRVGVRQFNQFEELATWCRGIDVDRDVDFMSPIWLFMKDGVVDRFYIGPHLGTDGEELLYRRVLGWLNGAPKEVPPSDFTRMSNWITSFWKPA